MAFVPSIAVRTRTWTTTDVAGMQQRVPQRQRSRISHVARRRHNTRMVAAQPKDTAGKTKTNTASPDTTAVLSDQAIVLLSYLRGHKSVFLPGNGFKGSTAALCKKNDTAREFTPEDQLETNASLLPGVAVAGIMVRTSDELILQAVQTTLSAWGSTKKGSPDESEQDVIADVLKYNYEALFRAVSYGAACQAVDYLHPDNIAMMKMLHEEMGVPSTAVAAGIDAVRDAVVEQVDDDAVSESTAQCFDAARDALL